MSAESHQFSVTDLRRAAKETKRSKDQKAKWAYGERPAQGKRFDNEESDRMRPIMPTNQLYSKLEHNYNQGSVNKKAAGVMQSLRRDLAEELIHPSDSSADEDIREASAAPEPDAEITYSYDAPHGPGRGSQILSLALAQAVEKFETKETEKLIKNEYEVVAKESEHDQEGYNADDDDFELI